MKINDQLNIVIPISDNLQLFSAPVSEQVFEANYRLLGDTQAQLFGKGMQKALLTGPMTAALALADVGRKLSAEEGTDDDFGASAFLAEIKRLTTVLLPGKQGWEMSPVAAAIQANVLDEADWKEAEALLVFFTCAYFLQPRRERAKSLELIVETLGCSTTSRNCGDYADSLQTSKQDAITPATAASSVPI